MGDSGEIHGVGPTGPPGRSSTHRGLRTSFVTVMKRTRKQLVCRWCGEEFLATPGPGRPKLYCRASHRQRAYEARRLGESRQLLPDEVIVSRRAWDALRDSLYRLESAAEDVAVDLEVGTPTKIDYVQALAHLSEAVRQLQDVSVEPVALGSD